MNRLAAYLHPTLAGSLEGYCAAIAKYPEEQQEQVAEALAAAAHWHSFVRRKSGPLYLAHVVQAATIAALVRADVSTVTACLLHDVLEDTEITGLQLEQRFGKEIRRLVEAVTKHSASSEKEFMEKVYALAKHDNRIALIKVADRIANLTHGSRSVFPLHKQLAYLEETDTYYITHLSQLPEIPSPIRALLVWARQDATVKTT